jgi:starch-binding outer membrane protein, SusD/RagB family
MRTQYTKAVVALTLAGALTVAACGFDITNPNSPTSIGPNATSAQVDAAAVGLLAALRLDYDNWVLKAAILGREGYRLDTADPRFTTELLAGPLDASNNAFGGGQWQPEYRTIAGGYSILNVIGTAQIPDPQKSAVRGFVQTIQALSFLNVLDAHTEDSIPIDVNRPVGGSLAQLVSNDSAYKAVVAILDSARTALESASSFPFDPGPGFVGFNTPATFLKFNRALVARVRAYQASLGALPAPIAASYGTAGWSPCPACWDSVLTALGQSFVNTGSALDLGVYNEFSTGNQDVPNALSQDPGSAINLAHPMISDSAELQTGGAAPDKRFLAKVTPRGAAFSLACLSSDLSWIRYPTPNAPLPIIRNEELILLRAEANWFAATGSKTQAISDLNFIRQTSGGLDPTTVTTASTDSVFVNALLHERLYSLMYEGGHRWIDMRRFGRLSQVIIDRPTGCAAAGIPKDTVFSTLPINSFEVQARQ